MRSRTIKVDYLARVEGEGSLYIKVNGGKVQDVQLRIFEPPRFFEALLRGRMYHEAPDITARICGICPVAYQMSSVHAMESALGIHIDGQIRSLRRLLYCGEWIESHMLHAFMLHAPDFLGYEDAIQMAKDHPETVRQALQMKKVGNDIVSAVGGREIHPINVRVGGFYKLPRKTDLQKLLEPLHWARDNALKLVLLTRSFEFPDFRFDYEFVSLRQPGEYPLNEGRLISNRGLDISISGYEDHFAEEHVGYTNALQSSLKEHGAFCVGPIARFNLNFDFLTPMAKQVAVAAGIEPPLLNPFESITIRCIETVFACEEAIRIIMEYEEPDSQTVQREPRAGIGWGCTEAPRGILYHRYRIDEKGMIADAKIVPPTAQNQKTIERDLARIVPTMLDDPENQIRWRLEQAVRNYDLCISCATHFLNLDLKRE